MQPWACFPSARSCPAAVVGCLPTAARLSLPITDEKHNFERLQRTTSLNRQPLLAPQPLDLSPTEALTVR